MKILDFLWKSQKKIGKNPNLVVLCVFIYLFVVNDKLVLKIENLGTQGYFI
jgi:hypothetical protein